MKPGTTSGNTDTTRQLSNEELVQSVVQQVKSGFTAEQQEIQRKTNISAVFTEAKTAYGEKVIEQVNAIGSKLGMSGKDIDDMAKNKPQVWRQLFLPKAGTTNNSTQPVSGDVNTASLNGKPEEKPFNVMKAKGADIAAEVQRRLKALED